MIDFDKDKAIELTKNIADKFSIKDTKSFMDKFKSLDFIDDMKLLFEMITDKDFELDKKTYLLIAGTLAYIVLPTDIIPDFIPGVGFIDDAFIIGFTIKQIKDEINRYKRFKGEEN